MRVAVIGTGHLGQHHARIYRSLPGCELVGIADPDPRRRYEVGTRTGVRAYADPRELLGKVDAVSVVVPTTLHREVASIFLEAGVHVLCEKPLAGTAEDARAIVDLAAEKKCVLQVGHIERFNPAIREAARFVEDPRYIVADRLSAYSFRSRDVGVVLDLMIHDLDIVLELVKDPVVSLEAIGVPVLSPSEDIADARLRFQGGALADLRSSRVSMKRYRKIRVFQRSAYLSIDYDTRRVNVFRRKKDIDQDAIDPLAVDPLTIGSDPQGYVFSHLLEVKEFEMDRGEDALTAELASFVEACRGEHPPVVPGEHGARAVEVAVRVMNEIKTYVRREAERAGLEIPVGFTETGDVLLPDVRSEEDRDATEGEPV